MRQRRNSIAREHRLVEVAPDDTVRGRRSPDETRSARSTVQQAITRELPFLVRDERRVVAHYAIHEAPDLDPDRSGDVCARMRRAEESQHNVPIEYLPRRHHHREVWVQDRCDSTKRRVGVLECVVEPINEELVQPDDLGAGTLGDIDVATLSPA
jgi:hypothetical protein